MNQTSHSYASPRVFPFAALVAQQPLQQALLLAAVDPALGGVLISGPRGTAKSTAARALAELLPRGRFVTLPLGASEEQLIGTLDLQAALRDGGVRFSPGLLAKAHEGVLYVDEVNLLPNPLVDQLLDVAASGVNIVERDGISHSHEARFVLVGTMNPEEGELRPQLLDRFGLAVELENCFDASLRQQIVKHRLAFDVDPTAFQARFAAQQTALDERLRAARAARKRYGFDDAVHARVSERCITASVDGLRADLVMLRAARALAALEEAPAVTVSHVDQVAEMVLRHRRRDDGDRLAPRARQTQGAPRANERVATSACERAAPPDLRVVPKPQAKDEPALGVVSGSQAGEPTSAEAAQDEAHGDADWGYLPPMGEADAAATDERSATNAHSMCVEGVKDVKPLHAKKA